MDEALEDFTSRESGNGNAIAIIDALHAYFYKSEITEDWVMRELCMHIMHTNPLYISSAKHSIFYSLVRTFASNFGTVNPPQYNIVIDGGVRIIEMSYLAGITVILRTLVDYRIHTRLQSVQDIPRPIVLLFLKRSGLRNYLMKKIFASVEDELELDQLYRESVIGNSALLQMQNLQRTAASYGNCETPINEPKQYRKRGLLARSLAEDEEEEEEPQDKMEVDGEHASNPDQGVCEILLPLRKAVSGFRVGIGTPNQLRLICTIYTYLRPALDNLLHEVAEKNVRVRQLCNLEFLFSVLYTSITECMDNQSSGSNALRELYSSEELQPLMTRMDEISLEIVNLMNYESDSLTLRLHHERHEQFAETFYEELESTFPEFVLPGRVEARAKATDEGEEDVAPKRSVPRRWIPVDCVTMPISMLMARLTADGSILTPMLRLKSFLSGRKRTHYLAYQLPKGTTRASLDLSLICIKERYVGMFPKLFESAHFVLVSRHTVYLVAKPEKMECLKMLMLVEALPDRPSIITYDYYTNVFLKASAVARPGTLLKQISWHCLLVSIAFMIGGKPAVSQLAHPDEPIYRLYEFLPELTQMLPNMGDEVQRKAMLGFLLLKRRNQRMTKVAFEILVERNPDPFPTQPELQAEIDRLARKNFVRSEDGRRSYKPCVLSGRCKVPLWISIYECIVTKNTTLSEHDSFALLCELGIEKCRNTFKKPFRNEMDVEGVVSPPLPLHTARTLYKDNIEMLEKIKNDTVLFRETDEMISAERLEFESKKQFAFTEFAFPRVFREVSVQHRQLAETVLRLEQLAFCYPEQRGHTANVSVFANRHLKNYEYEYQLSLDDQKSITFEDCLFLCDNPSKWVQSTQENSDLLFASPMETVVDCSQLLELVLLYNEDWIRGDVSAGTRFAKGRYSEMIRLIQARQEHNKPKSSGREEEDQADEMEHDYSATEERQ